ncbi:hypothetical protein [Candidatus Methanoprimaticola sp. MG2]|uniref:hypothetical protein n=1 Tax=Candidatus Methanoprimaticola sp. MG2 TaxID=3228838 RepID=UPI0039C7603C
MEAIGDVLFGIFGADGGWGVVLCIFLIFFIDALLFPTLPELFFILGFSYDPSIEFGLLLLGAAVIAEWVGIFSLYYITEHVRIPQKVTRVVGKYKDFLLVSDERLLLLNRIAPTVPFAGAFISIVKWDLKKSWFYITIGCILKYGVIMLLSDQMYKYYAESATTMTIVMLVVILAVSFILSYVVKKRKGLDRDAEDSPKNN